MVSVLPPGIDVRKLQRSHSRDKSGRAFIRFTKPSFFRFTYPVYLSDLACSHQTLSDISLDRSEVKSDKLLDVNAARKQCNHVFAGRGDFKMVLKTIAQCFTSGIMQFLNQHTSKY